MTLLKIAQMGHPVLWARAAPVPLPLDVATQRIVDDMIATMRDAPGVGLAAPQVYQPLRLIVILPDRESNEPVVLVNPELEPVGDEVVFGIEGCLSIPDWHGVVGRWQTVRYRAVDRDGAPLAGEASGFHARVLQHEVDHLDGILYPMRLRDPHDLAVTREAHYLSARLDAYALDPREDTAA